MNPPSFIVPYLKPGLDDHYDVKMPCHLILSKLADKCQSAVLAELDSLVDPLQNTINFKPKQEVDRYEDLIRRALRAIASLNRISGGDCSLKFKNLMTEISKFPTLWDTYCSIKNE
ncbi:cullin-associated NEDD8-dissociated protein 1-like [Quercus lobata]|uniref:cullin-associated NEDD8-dissociated protein 1-like n=1 Tax=Quercus lobata TaxID=97700 RepID=UPI00124854A7|nr:cullin-associated NEDD8-dissociated protein 1-like [Quercus lobata]